MKKWNPVYDTTNISDILLDFNNEKALKVYWAYKLLVSFLSKLKSNAFVKCLQNFTLCSLS